jgi:hypothetical protein
VVLTSDCGIIEMAIREQFLYTCTFICRFILKGSNIGFLDTTNCPIVSVVLFVDQMIVVVMI